MAKGFLLIDAMSKRIKIPNPDNLIIVFKDNGKKQSFKFTLKLEEMRMKRLQRAFRISANINEIEAAVKMLRRQKRIRDPLQGVKI